MNIDGEDSHPLAEQLTLVKKIVAAGVIGLVLGVSSAGYGVWWLAWCAMAPFLVLIRACKSWLETFLVGVTFGLAYNLTTLFWLYSLHIDGVSAQPGVVMADLTALVDATVRALPCALLSLLLYTLPMRAGIFPDYKRPFFPYILTVPVVWIFFEHMGGLTLGTCINGLCYSQSGQFGLIQIARLGGARLLTFLLALSNTAIAQLLIASGNLVKPLGQRTDRLLPVTGSLVDLMTVVLLVILCALIGHGSPGSCLNNNVPKIAVSISRIIYGVTVSMQGHVIVETAAVGASANSAVGTSSLLHAPSNFLYLKTRSSCLSTILSLPSHVLRCIYPAASIQFDNYLASLPRCMIQVADTPWGRVGISTGIAKAGSSLEKEEVRQGAGLLVCIMDPGCFHSTILDREILAAAVMAAVENGRYMILSIRNGTNAIINPCGKIVAARPLAGTSNILSDQIQFLYRNNYFINVDFY